MINGSYLRKLRKSHHYTLIEFSKEIGCTASFLSQLERGQKEPSIATLRKLSEVLGVPIASFFLPEEELIPQTHSSGYVLTRKENRPVLPSPVPGVHCELLNPHPDSEEAFPINGFYFYLPPHTPCYEGIGLQQNAGGICMHSGELHAIFEDRELVLHQHDCLYIQAGVPHNLENRSDSPCEFYMFCN